MLKYMFILISLISLLEAGWVSKKQFLNILDFNTAVDKVILENQDKPEFKKFRRYVFGIYFQESSYGKYSYSDTEEDKYYYVHQGERIYITENEYNKAKKFSDGSGKYVKPKYWGKRWLKRIYVLPGQLKPITEASIGPTMFRVATARFLIEHYKMKKHYDLLTNDKKIVNKLLNDMEFGIYLTFMYMKFNYDSAIRNGYDRPVLRAVSRHNGGWSNWDYVDKVEAGIEYTINALEENRYNINLQTYLKSRKNEIKKLGVEAYY